MADDPGIMPVRINPGGYATGVWHSGHLEPGTAALHLKQIAVN
jgi:hypothetical protein